MEVKLGRKGENETRLRRDGMEMENKTESKPEIVTESTWELERKRETKQR